MSEDVNDGIITPQEVRELEEVVDYNYLNDLTKEQLISKYIELDERVNDWPKMTRAQLLEAVELLKDYPKRLLQATMFLEQETKQVAQSVQTLKDMLFEISEHVPAEETDEVAEETTVDGEEPSE